MLKKLNQKSWNLLFPDFIFDHLLEQINVHDDMVDSKNQHIFIDIAKGLMFIFLQQKEGGFYEIEEYIRFLIEMGENERNDKSKWVMGVCIMSFVNFMNINFSNIELSELNNFGYKLMGL